LQVQKAKPGYKLVKSNFGKEIEIPEEWIVVRVNEIGTLKSGGTPSTQNNDYWKNGNIPWINSGEVKNKPISNFSKLITKKGLEASAANLFPPNTIVIALTGATTGKVGILTFECSTNQSITGIFPSKKYHSYFLFYMMIFLKKQILRYSIGSAQPHINQGIVEKFFIPFPSITEQEKITSILSNVDSLIQKYDSIIQTTKKLKQGLMQHLLTKGIGHKKFKKVKWLFGKEIEIPNNWVRKKVVDVFKLKSGSTPSRTKPEFFAGDIPWVTSTDLNRSKITSTLEKITKDAVKDANLTILPKGTFVIATYGLEAAGTRGKCGILEIEAAFNQACMAFLPSSEMSSMFLFYFYLYFGEKIIFSIAQGTKQQNLYSDTVKKVILIIPPLKEQEKITLVFSEIDSKIDDLESKKSSLENLKKGLMQKLLTGQIRVKF